ncbi:Mov34/MPN/PAD-1 family protein [Sphingomonas montanisoli]|uniref:M67 family metallopeptidase n=1 Tax=Sphingomonas montanisoli TaxID=2606412 RepID=A0A5D9CD70_9SPHN|nr:M67 family metallopeptidase [Sphingomonas montanisoli]TZG29614.1 M67 family metallopeptidase [Sphingomonas montanisoli]
MNLRISRAMLEDVAAHAARDPTLEVCGLLLGERGVVEAIRPCANVADDPARRFEIDPAALFAAHKAARRGEAAAPIGHYHSHPSGRAEPSMCDAAAAEPGTLWLIVGEEGVRAWIARPGGARHDMFDEVTILSVDEP